MKKKLRLTQQVKRSSLIYIYSDVRLLILKSEAQRMFSQRLTRKNSQLDNVISFNDIKIAENQFGIFFHFSKCSQIKYFI